jgi:hypothetical protein
MLAFKNNSPRGAMFGSTCQGAMLRTEYGCARHLSFLSALEAAAGPTRRCASPAAAAACRRITPPNAAALTRPVVPFYLIRGLKSMRIVTGASILSCGPTVIRLINN